MSRLYSPIQIPDGFNINISKQSEINIKYKSIEETIQNNPLVKILEKNNHLHFQSTTEEKDAYAQSITMFVIVRNLIIGMSKPYEKNLKMIGVGYKVEQSGQELTFSANYSHTVKFTVDKRVNVKASGTSVELSCYNKHLLGQVAASIREIRKPEVYKGKGIRYEDEVVVIKARKKK